MSRTRYLAAFSILLAALLGACKTIQRDVAVEKLPEESFALLDEYEGNLVALEAGGDKEGLPVLRGRLAKEAERPVLDRTYSARLAALSGRAALLAGDRREAERELKTALSLHPEDELARVLEARLERDDAKRLALLEAALVSSDGQARLQAERGRTLLAAGRYAEALAAFDASLPFLPDVYEQAYGAERRRALALRNASPSITKASPYLTDRPLTLEGMAGLTQSESALLDFLTGGKVWAPSVLFERLRSGGYYTDSAAPASTPARRGDAAQFLWRLAANRKNDRSLLSRYSQRYASRPNPRSPVPDVPLDAPWFDAVLGCVEREVMELPDGRLFYPQDPITGLEFYGWLKKAADL